jgi:DNA polymerase III subunit delta'
MSLDLIVHPAVRAQLDQYIATPSHAVLLVGTNGIGKGTLAEYLACAVLQIKADKLADYPYVYRVVTEKDAKSISIESIRTLQKFLQLKTIGTTPIRRVVIIEHAGIMTVEAQNAFLKLLEEPPTDTVIILTADNQRALLPTILSRTQVLSLYPPTEVAIKKYFIDQNKEGSAITQAFFLSGGLPGLMSALLSNADHPMLKSIAIAKELLQKTPFERLAAVEQLAKQKNEAIAVIEALIIVAQAMLAQSANKAETAKIKQWHRILKVADQARVGLLQSGNTKLVLTNTMLQM